MRLIEIIDKLFAELDNLEDEANSANIVLKISHEDDTLYLDHIGRKNDQKGSAKPIMKKLTNIADKYKQNIKLYTASYEPKLIQYYEQFGFVPDPEEYDEAYLVRHPL